jgi:hypothetical protein
MSDHRLQPVWEAAHRAANDAGHCEVFDELMDEIGAPRRQRDQEIEITLTFNTTITVSATDEDEARDLIGNLSDGEVADLIYDENLSRSVRYQTVEIEVS